jgi:hypothetical protein
MRHTFFLLLTIVLCACALPAGENLLDDPSFEIPRDPDQFGHVFAKWAGWKYDGDCAFQVSELTHTGKYACLLAGFSSPKIRISQGDRELEPGRYRITAFLRGLDIAENAFNTEFMFDGKYIPLKKGGTFGWTKLTYVADIFAKKKVPGPSFGLLAAGLFWIDDVTLEKVDPAVAVTPAPVLGDEEAPIVPPGKATESAVRCSACAYRNMADWKKCYACGATLMDPKSASAGPATRLITSFEEKKSPFSGGTVVDKFATDGKNALRIDSSYVSIEGAQNWQGYDYLKADLHTEADEPQQVYIEIRDKATKGYWDRVNYTTVVPPGQSELVLPLRQMYTGEKSRPGRMVMLGSITRLVISIGKAAAPLFVDNVRLVRDESAQKLDFDGLYAFDFGTKNSPVLEGFTSVNSGTVYSKGRGYGLLNAKVWKAFDVLQPDPLYQDFICINSGGFAVDLPNGQYHVFVNMDNPSGYWGEYQVYDKRAVLAEGKEVVSETMNLESFRKKYYRFWNSDDLPTEDTFDKYQKAYFSERQFDVDVTDGQLNIDFKGEGYACSLSALIIYPQERAADGQKFLKFVEDKRRFYFNNYFKRVLHRPSGELLAPTDADKARGYVLFSRPCMDDVYYNDTPVKDEIVSTLQASCFAGEYTPLSLGVVPLKNLGNVTVTADDLTGPGTIASSEISVGFVSYRVSRVTMEGSVYTIAPRMIMPSDTVAVPENITRTFWLSVKTSVGAKPGVYKGLIKIHSEKGGIAQIPVELAIRHGMLDAVDVPAGPWGHTINLPWRGAEVSEWNDQMSARSLRRLRDYGFTSFTGLPVLKFLGFKDGKPQIDFAIGDAQMKRAREAGFTQPIITYCNFTGLNLYAPDTERMKAAGFTDYSEFIKAIFTEVQKHADENNWLPVYWNLGDEPLGDALTRSIENAEAYRKAFPKGPPFFTAASSYSGTDVNDPHFKLGKALHVADWNLHSEDSVKLLHDNGSDWGFYNGGNRWTYGIYMYKAAKQFGMKFRVSWHWNVVAGDPYFALDCREDDYAWCNNAPDGTLIPSLNFERIREGLGDYRRLLTLARLLKEHPNTPAATAAGKLMNDRMNSFKLGQRDHDALFGKNDWIVFRRDIDAAIEALQQP